VPEPGPGGVEIRDVSQNDHSCYITTGPVGAYGILSVRRS
jgi:hypothetical protein